LQASSTSLERNKQLLERFTQTIKSEITQVNVIDYINAYMRYWLLYEEELLDGGKTKKIVYRYDWLIDEGRRGGAVVDVDVQITSRQKATSF
jgi:hypothetical protein